MRYLQRPELMREIDPLPSHYWEPMPDEEDIAEYNARIKEEYERKLEAGEAGVIDELPFM